MHSILRDESGIWAICRHLRPRLEEANFRSGSKQVQDVRLVKLFQSNIAAREISTIVRFVVVGLFNTAIGFGFILAALFLGAGDYLANALGFAAGIPIAYALHRRFSFKLTAAPSRAEFTQFLAVFLIAYGMNIGVLAVGRKLGYVESPAAQLLAIACYSAVLYVLNRLIVFRGSDTASAPRD